MFAATIATRGTERNDASLVTSQSEEDSGTEKDILVNKRTLKGAKSFHRKVE